MKLLNRLANFIGWTVMLVVLAAVAAWWQGVPYLESEISRTVSQRYSLSPEAEVTARLEGPRQVLRGEINSLTVVSPEGRVSGMPVRDFRLETGGLTFRPVETALLGTPKLSEIDEGNLSFRITESALRERWSDRAEPLNITDLKVDLSESGGQITGRLNLETTRAEIFAEGEFRADGSRVRFVPNGRNVDGSSAAADLLDRLIEDLEPGVDLAELGGSFRVATLKPSDGSLFVQGRAGDTTGQLAERGE